MNNDDLETLVPIGDLIAEQIENDILHEKVAELEAEVKKLKQELEEISCKTITIV